MSKKIKAEIKEGIEIGADVYDDNGKLIGEFGFRCANCEGTKFVMSQDFTYTTCLDCDARTSDRLVGEFKLPKESPMRKYLAFDTSFGGTFIWKCSLCGHDIQTLATNFSTTNCERCKGVTARRKGMDVAVDGKVRWEL